MKLPKKVGSFEYIYYICININDIKTNNSMKKGFLYRVYDLYYDGFRQMRLGRTLWTIIAIKLFIIFAILKVFFFPNYIKEHANKGQEAEFVATQTLNLEDESEK